MMNLSQIRFGEVLHNVRLDDYARVVGLREVNGTVRIEVHQPRARAEDMEVKYKEYIAKEHCIWDLEDCMSQTPLERGGGDTIYTVFQSEQEHLDREV